MAIEPSLFDELMREFGGRFELPPEQSDELSLFDYHRSKAEKWIALVQKERRIRNTLPSIYFDYVNNPQLNAVAVLPSPGTIGFIGIFAGSIIIIHTQFLRLLATPTVLPNIGDIRLEKEPSQKLQPYVTDAGQLIREGAINKQPLDHVKPVDPIRKAYARLLAKIAVDFILTHEAAHLLNGHVGWLRQLTGIPFMLELGQNHATQITPLIRQTLEWDADTYATSQGMANVLAYVDKPDVLPEIWRHAFASIDDALQTWYFSIYMFFRLFGTQASAFNLLETGAHPPFPMRAFSVACTMDEVIRVRKGEVVQTQSRCNELTARMSIECEEAYAKITGQEKSLWRREFGFI